MKKILILGPGTMMSTLLERLPQGFEIHCYSKSQVSSKNFVRLHPTVKCVGIHDIREHFYDYVFLGVKPQKCQEVATEVSFQAKELVSILAGTTIQKLREIFPTVETFTRLMPNLMARFGKSVHLVYGERKESKTEISAIFSSSGSLYWVEHETLIDHLTPIFGSGAAVFALVFKEFEDYCLAQGLNREDFFQLFTTFTDGLYSQVKDQPDWSELIQNISSKGGVTERMVHTLQNLNFSKDLKHALEEGKKRTEELNQN